MPTMLSAQDLGRARAFYVEEVGCQPLESDFLKARDGQVGLVVGRGVSRLFVYTAWFKDSEGNLVGVVPA